ncbi:hypothetical protein C8Q80DRAFT_1121804 [Daedaleopsis nitida]|nr:hypothetical protein C8Q80DRAFT_1121804 [Daedaleopsis nitida]
MIAPKFLVLATLVGVVCVGTNARPVSAGARDAHNHGVERPRAGVPLVAPTMSTPSPAVPTTNIPPASLVVSTTSIPQALSGVRPTDTSLPALPGIPPTNIRSAPVHLVSNSEDGAIARSIPTVVVSPPVISGSHGMSTMVSVPSAESSSTPVVPSTPPVDAPAMSTSPGGPVITQPASHVGPSDDVTTTTTSYEPQPTSDEPEPTDDAPSYGDDPYEDGGWTPDPSDPEEPSEGDQDDSNDEDGDGGDADDQKH